METNIQAKVNVRIDKQNLETGIIHTEEYHNLAVDNGLNLIRDLMQGTGATGLSRFALGTGTTAEASTDTQLVTEVFRDQFTKVTPSDKQLEIKYYLGSTVANGNTISEAGLFGNGATNTANSGTLYARVTFPGDDKTSAEAWTFTWDLTFEVV